MKRIVWSFAGTLVAVFLMQAGATPTPDRQVYGPSQGALPQPSGTAGGGGGIASPTAAPMVVPVAPVNPHGVDAIPTPAGGGGGPSPDLQSPARNPGNDLTPERALSPSSTRSATSPSPR